MENLNSWQLIQLGEFNLANKKAEVEYKLEKNLPSLRHKLYALLNLRKYSEALNLAEKIIEINLGITDDDFIFSGICLWLLDKKEEAIQKWATAEETHFKDASG